MQTLFTVGTTGRHDDDFIAVLKANQIDAVIDIRLRNEGRYYKFASGKHIKALCEAHGIAYRHDTRFAPSAEMLRRYKTYHDWLAYEPAYRALIAERDMRKAWLEIASGFQRPCFLCAEKTAEHCHRRLLGEALLGGEADKLRHL
jgi:uncharacterized protein (DUF488 family)